MTYSNTTTTRLKGQHLTAIERGKLPLGIAKEYPIGKLPKG
ncbi:hypothetical protein OMQ_00591 [Enterococcus saccharolyticus subsp. saccharolyticus ATCC 43076]|uniref:Uncharacterized protein n=1 Tax=Enterococcus saccharolyticus subsp. saccharolyticus ATCC 43076 TaxID=1139996 RepID=S0NG89_9ENTE|nr:hypothetical protein OMQ_00591 [Enterococcus saccharolyticus subsp. saccharolyticus ATCC 43076]EOT80447.1 hypothetical protein I572_00973 [Enterococcus saccharolyticus subsp. saccharolyticus ATCC 43076]